MKLKFCYFGMFPPWITQDRPHTEGFAVFMLDWLSAHLGFDYQLADIDITPLLRGDVSAISFYQDSVRSGACDLGLTTIDTPTDFNNDGGIAHTGTVVHFLLSVLVRKQRRSIQGWGMLEPFTRELWAAIMGMWLLVSLTIAAIDMLRPRGAVPLRVLTLRSLYYSAAALVGGDVHEWVRWPSKLVHLAVLIFTMVVLASYTASLTSFFTRPTHNLVGPLTRAALWQQRSCVPNAGYLAIAGAFTPNVLTPPLDIQVKTLRGACQGVKSTLLLPMHRISPDYRCNVLNAPRVSLHRRVGISHR